MSGTEVEEETEGGRNGDREKERDSPLYVQGPCVYMCDLTYRVKSFDTVLTLPITRSSFEQEHCNPKKKKKLTRDS